MADDTPKDTRATDNASVLEPAASAVLLAIGPSGNAEAEPLLWASVAGRPLLAWSIDAFAAATQIREIALVMPPARLLAAQTLIAAAWQHVHIVAAPGIRQRDAVLAGLEALPADDALVVLHHCNRPLVTPELIAQGIALAAQSPGSGAVAWEPVKETIKRVAAGVVVATPPRAHLALLQTPQVFPRTALIEAYQRYDAELDTPDVASLLLAMGLHIETFASGPANLAVCWPDDFAVAEAQLHRRMGR